MFNPVLAHCHKDLLFGIRLAGAGGIGDQAVQDVLGMTTAWRSTFCANGAESPPSADLVAPAGRYSNHLKRVERLLSWRATTLWKTFE